MFRHPLVAELVDFGYQAVEEVTVVRHHDQRTVEVEQRLFQDVFRFHVQVIRRLIEDQQVDRFEQQLDHRQTCALASRQNLHLLG